MIDENKDEASEQEILADLEAELEATKNQEGELCPWMDRGTSIKYLEEQIQKLREELADSQTPV